MSRPTTAFAAELLSCHICSQLSRRPSAAGRAYCPRCDARLHPRKPESLSATWALLVAAVIMYLPANLLPIMETSSFGVTQHDTIMSGVIFLWASGSWPLAVLVFFASVMVPLLKIMAMAFLLMSVHRRSVASLPQRARLYRVVEFVGRWSMLDIYVIVILVALVRFQGLAAVQAGPASTAFGAVVILSMLAAMSFDPRLMWDQLDAGRTDGGIPLHD